MTIRTAEALIDVARNLEGMNAQSRESIARQNMERAAENRAKAQASTSKAVRRFYHQQVRWYELCARAAIGKVGR